MENVDPICSCLNGFTEAQKKQADAIAGGSFEKILVELQIIRSSSRDNNLNTRSDDRFKMTRADDIRDIFFLRQEKENGSDLSVSLASIFSSTRSENLFENSRASDIRNIFFLQQEKLKESDPDPQLFDTDAPLDLEKLRRDPSAPFETPNFLEKQFQLFGPTIISRFV